MYKKLGIMEVKQVVVKNLLIKQILNILWLV